jgi:hypothetical protein
VDCAIKKKAELDKKYAGSGEFKGSGGSARDKYKHCVYACEIAKECGKPAAWFVSVGKEVLDAVPFDENQCEWGDLVADKKGIGIGKSPEGDCEKECDKEYPDKPPCADEGKKAPSGSSGGRGGPYGIGGMGPFMYM